MYVLIKCVRKLLRTIFPEASCCVGFHIDQSLKSQLIIRMHGPLAIIRINIWMDFYDPCDPP